RDKFFRHGEALLAAAVAPDPLERCLAVVRYALGVMADVLRPGGPDPDDLPVCALGHHHVTVRQLGSGAGAAVGDAGAPPPAPRVHVQEILSFDPKEGPKALALALSPPAAVSLLRVEPRAVVKAKRLGRDIFGLVAAARRPAGAVPVLTPAPAGPCLLSRTGLQQHLCRNYMPPPPPFFPSPPLPGDLLVQCPATGLLACLAFKEEGAVKGSLEQQQRQGGQAGQAAARAGGGAPLYGALGSFSGSLHDTVRLTCPALGMEGVVHSEQPPSAAAAAGTGAAAGAVRPPLAPAVNLSQPGPQQLPRLWTALHDSLLYNDPKLARGGKAAEELSHRLAASLYALFDDETAAAAAGGAPAPAAAAANTARGVGSAAAESGAAATAGADSGSDSDFDAAEREEGDGPEDPRDVPPSLKAQHAAGHRLMWQVQYSVVLPPLLGPPLPAVRR
ncbi:hypothetical protein TSOC_012159, partial [Tetrabaena socialis]